jgi:hypothetical protein
MNQYEKNIRASLKNSTAFGELSLNEKKIVSKIIRPTIEIKSAKITRRNIGNIGYSDWCMIQTWLTRIQLGGSGVETSQVLASQLGIQPDFQQKTPSIKTAHRLFQKATETIFFPIENQILKQVKNLKLPCHLCIDIGNLKPSSYFSSTSSNTSSSSKILALSISFALPFVFCESGNYTKNLMFILSFIYYYFIVCLFVCLFLFVFVCY